MENIKITITKEQYDKLVRLSIIKDGDETLIYDDLVDLVYLIDEDTVIVNNKRNVIGFKQLVSDTMLKGLRKIPKYLESKGSDIELSAESSKLKVAEHIYKINKIDVDTTKIIKFWLGDNVTDDDIKRIKFTKVTDKKKASDIANDMMSNYNVVSYNSKIFIKLFTTYTSNENELMGFIASKYSVDADRAKSALKTIDVLCTNKKDPNSPLPILLPNGYIHNGEYKSGNYRDFARYSISTKYNEEAEAVEAVDKLLNHLSENDEDTRAVIERMCAMSLIQDNRIKNIITKFFIILGDGKNGKGTLLKLLENTLGASNVASVSLEQISDNTYLSRLEDKLINLGDDIKDKAIDEDTLKIVKGISSCDTITTREIYEKSKSVVISSTLIFSSNHLLKSHEKGDSFLRRIVYIPAYTKVEKTDNNFMVQINSTKAKEYFLKILVDRAKEITEAVNNGTHDELFVSEKISKFQANYESFNNNIINFFYDIISEYGQISKALINGDYIGKMSLYNEYCTWAESNKERPLKKATFYGTLKNQLGFKEKSQAICKITGKRTKECFHIDKNNVSPKTDEIISEFNKSWKTTTHVDSSLNSFKNGKLSSSSDNLEDVLN